jgi:hypothetical protein
MVLFRRQVSQIVYLAVTRGLFISRSDTKSTADRALHLVSISFYCSSDNFYVECEWCNSSKVCWGNSASLAEHDSVSSLCFNVQP